MAERICIAQIGAPHGVRGEVRLRSFTDEPVAVANYGALDSEDGSRSFVIEELRQAKDHLVARLRGISDRDAAEALTNLRLYVPRDRLPATEDADTFYHADLIGLAVVATDGRAIGELIAIHNFGAGEILEIRPQAGGNTVMLPFTDTVVPQMDLAGGRIVVDPPDGALSSTAADEANEGQA